MTKYVRAAGHDQSRALALYIWNAELSAALFPLIQTFEVTLRNRMQSALSSTYGRTWHQNAQFLNRADKYHVNALTDCLNRLHRMKKPTDIDQIVSNLSFGFWASLLESRYYNMLWKKNLSGSFPNFKLHKLSLLHDRTVTMRDLRNRIFHHEPIFQRNISQDHHDILEAIDWMCVDTAAWIKQQSRVLHIISQKP